MHKTRRVINYLIEAKKEENTMTKTKNSLLI